MTPRWQATLIVLTMAAGCMPTAPQDLAAVEEAEVALTVDVSFAGSYTRSDPGSYSGCAYSNILSGFCGCPEGSVSYPPFRVLHDSFGYIYGGGLSYCGPSSVSKADFGGAYQSDDPVPGGVGCRVANSFTGDCSCPSGTTANPLRVIVDSSAGWIGSHVFFCRRSLASSFGGAYQKDDAVPGGLGCRNPNPYTKACSCPRGYTKDQSLRVIADVAAGFIGSNIHVCAPPVPKVALCSGRYADPTGQVSARAALQACIDANYGKTLNLPPGDFLIDGDETQSSLPPVTITRSITISTQGTSASQGACLSSSSVRCARLLAAPSLHRNGGIVKVTGSGVGLDHIILDGNRSGRVLSQAWNKCAAGSNRYGFNAQVEGADNVSFTYSASINAVCGTGLEWTGDNALVQSSIFLANGDHASTNLWSDGLTLLRSAGAIIKSNQFIDASDVGFIVGSAPSAKIQNNVITQSGQRAFAGFMMDNFNGVLDGDFTNALISGNTITCVPWSQCDYAANLGPHAWYESGITIGGTFTQNSISGGYIALNVDGAGTLDSPLTISGNTVSTGAGSSTLECLFPSNFNVMTADSVVNSDVSPQSELSTHFCHPR